MTLDAAKVSSSVIIKAQKDDDGEFGTYYNQLLNLFKQEKAILK